MNIAITAGLQLNPPGFGAGPGRFGPGMGAVIARKVATGR